MNLGEHYSKSIIRKFDYVPVYLPGTEISPGAILSFGTDFFGSAAKPYGTFHVVGNLIGGKTYNFPLEVKDYPSKASFNFISQNEVQVSAAVKGKVPNVVDGDIEFTFGKEGSILLYAIQPTESRIEDQFELEKHLNQVIDDREWDQFYIVTSVFTCKKALVYQSNDRGGSLIVSASAKDINVTGTGITNVDASASFNVKWKAKEAFGTVDWADDVALFMKLVRFKKKKLTNNKKAQALRDEVVEGGQAVAQDKRIERKQYQLIEVNPEELLEQRD